MIPCSRLRHCDMGCTRAIGRVICIVFICPVSVLSACLLNRLRHLILQCRFGRRSDVAAGAQQRGHQLQALRRLRRDNR
eukprot:36321-Eustigmatos_ZCMA.PRE.1